jgi:signal transduction histidine kinase
MTKHLCHDASVAPDRPDAIERELAMLVRSTATTSALFDTKMRYLAASDRWLVEHGLEGRHALGQPYDGPCAGLPERWRDAHCRALAGEAVTSEGGSSGCEAVPLPWSRWSVTPWRNEQGAIGGVVIATSGPSGFDRQRAELDRRMREADRISSLGMLGAGLGHELGNILLPMQAHLNALRAAAARGAMPDVLKMHLASIGAGISYLRHLADGTQRLGRLDEPGMEAVSSDGSGSRASPSDWWPSVEGLLRCVLPSSTSLEVDVPSSCPAPRVHSNALMQSLLNLLVNARDAIVARHGADGCGGEIRVAFARIGCGRRTRVRVSVLDNGAGMDESTLARAREPFFTTKPGGRGTGLGLATVAAMVEECGGQLSIRSVVDSGTEVTVTLPAVLSVLG